MDALIGAGAVMASEIERADEENRKLRKRVKELETELRSWFGDHYPSRCSLGMPNCFLCGTSWPCMGAVKELRSRVKDPIEEYEEYERMGKGE